MRVICAGCGRVLPAGRGRGRPAWFHDATCRKRAHRARVASRHAELLGEVEAAVSELRRVVLAGEPSPRARTAAAWLTRAAGELVRRLDDTTTTTTTAVPFGSVEDAAAAVDQPAPDQPATHQVTKTVTNQGGGPGRVAERLGAEAVSAQPRPPAAAVPTPATTPAVKPGGPALVSRRRVARPEPLDLDTVRLERIVTEAGESAGWRVLAGDLDTPIQVGTVKRGRRGRWEALTASLVEVPGGPWRSRQDAVVYLLDRHQRTPTTRAGARSR